MLGKNKAETYEDDSPRKHHVKLIAFAGFLVVVAVVLYTSNHGNFSLTGAFAGVPDANDSMKIAAKLNVPRMKVDGEFGYVGLTGNSDSVISIGKQESSLSEREINNIILNNFDGEIYFDDSAVFNLDGKSENAVVNGVVLSSSSDKPIKTSFDSDFYYSSLEISDSVFIRKLAYNASGTIDINDGKNSFHVDGERINLNNFFGDLKVKGGVMTLEGVFDKLEIDSEKIVVG